MGFKRRMSEFSKFETWTEANSVGVYIYVLMEMCGQSLAGRFFGSSILYSLG